MEPLVRGIVERFIDSQLSEETLRNRIHLMRSLKPNIRSEEDAVFGLMLGEVFGRLLHYYRYFLEREATDEEIEDYFKIISRRAIEIKSKIREIANL